MLKSVFFRSEDYKYRFYFLLSTAIIIGLVRLLFFRYKFFIIFMSIENV